jgi:hypothetical protein
MGEKDYINLEDLTLMLRKIPDILGIDVDGTPSGEVLLSEDDALLIFSAMRQLYAITDALMTSNHTMGEFIKATHPEMVKTQEPGLSA